MTNRELKAFYFPNDKILKVIGFYRKAIIRTLGYDDLFEISNLIGNQKDKNYRKQVNRILSILKTNVTFYNIISFIYKCKRKVILSEVLFSSFIVYEKIFNYKFLNFNFFTNKYSTLQITDGKIPQEIEYWIATDKETNILSYVQFMNIIADNINSEGGNIE